MSYAKRMLETYPGDFGFDADALARCVEACHDCAQACTACADACLGEENVADLRRCVRTNLDCADICAATGRVLSRQTEYDAGVTRTILQACAEACRTCGGECEEHGQHGMKHCAVCAEACRRCERACEELLAAIA